MNRRGFLQRIGIGAGAAAAASVPVLGQVEPARTERGEQRETAMAFASPLSHLLAREETYMHQQRDRSRFDRPNVVRVSPEFFDLLRGEVGRMETDANGAVYVPVKRARVYRDPRLASEAMVFVHERERMV